MVTVWTPQAIAIEFSSSVITPGWTSGSSADVVAPGINHGNIDENTRKLIGWLMIMTVQNRQR